MVTSYFLLVWNRKLQCWWRLKDNTISNSTRRAKVPDVYYFGLNKYIKLIKEKKHSEFCAVSDKIRKAKKDNKFSKNMASNKSAH